MASNGIKVSVVGNSIFVGNTKFEERSRWASIPAGYWKKKMGKWQYPRSPFTAFRIKWTANKLNRSIIPDKQFNELLRDMQSIRSTAHYCKSKDAINLAKKHVGEAFLTDTKPWPHQIVAAEFTRGRDFAYLAMDMGTGKTLVGINEIYYRNAKTVLIVCPKSVIDVWVAEFNKHKPSKRRRLLVLDYGGSTKKSELVQEFVKCKTSSESIILCNYESVWRGRLGAALLDIPFDIIIYDEIHRLKSPSSSVSRFCVRLCSNSNFRLGLSGTPLPNGISDAYAQYRALDTGIFGLSVSKFRQKYFVMNPHVDFPQILAVKPEQKSKFEELLDLTMYRVEKNDVLDLPEFVHTFRYFNLSSSTRKVYDAMEEDFVAHVKSGMATASNSLAKMMRLHQITSGFIKTEDEQLVPMEDEKSEVLEDILRDIKPGEPVCVFCLFKRDLLTVELVAHKLGLRYKELSGDRKELENGAFPSGCDILGIQTQSGGLGIDLTKSAVCIFYSFGYSLAEYLQCHDRLHRGGQSRKVLYIHLLAKNTIDEEIYGAIQQKKEFVDEVLAKIKQDSIKRI